MSDTPGFPAYSQILLKQCVVATLTRSELPRTFTGGLEQSAAPLLYREYQSLSSFYEISQCLTYINKRHTYFLLAIITNQTTNIETREIVSRNKSEATAAFNTLALVRPQPLYFLLRIKQGPVFLINSR